MSEEMEAVKDVPADMPANEDIVTVRCVELPLGYYVREAVLQSTQGNTDYGRRELCV